MFTFETSDQKEVRRFRIAQFNGRTATVRSAGSAVTGHARPIVENKSSVPAAWTLTIIPEEPKPTLVLQPAPRARPHTEEFPFTAQRSIPWRPPLPPHCEPVP